MFSVTILLLHFKKFTLFRALAVKIKLAFFVKIATERI